MTLENQEDRPIKGQKKHLSAYQKAEVRTAWIMLSPALILVGVIALYPALRTIWLSLHEMVLTDPTSGYPFVGLSNYTKFFADARAWDSLAFTLKFTVVTVAVEFGLGLGSALAMDRAFKGRGLVRAAMLVPWAIPTAVSAMMWKFIYNDQYGLFNDVLSKLHLIDHYQAWLSTESGSFLALVIADVWKTTPFIALLLLAGLQMIPKELYESATLDGANYFQQLWNVTLPMLRGSIFVALLFRTLDAFRVFDLVSVLTDGANNTESLSLYAYKNMMKFLDFGYGSTAAVIVFLVVLVIALIYMRFMKREITEVD